MTSANMGMDAFRLSRFLLTFRNHHTLSFPFYYTTVNGLCIMLMKQPSLYGLMTSKSLRGVPCRTFSNIHSVSYVYVLVKRLVRRAWKSRVKWWGRHVPVSRRELRASTSPPTMFRDFDDAPVDTDIPEAFGARFFD
jgi:hypothetical protein